MLIKNEEGFSLVGILLVAIIVILVMLVPRFISKNNELETGLNLKVETTAIVCKANLSTINTQLQRHYLETGNHIDSASWNSFIADTNYFPDGALECPAGPNGDRYLLGPNNSAACPHGPQEANGDGTYTLHTLP